jgi:hypothetical protein
MFPPGTLLQSDAGPIDVRRLDGHEKLQVFSWSNQPRYRPIRRVFMANSPGKVFCISTASGRRFCATPDQPFAVRVEPSHQYHDLFLAKREGLGFFLVIGNGLFRDSLENRILFKRQDSASKESVWLLSSHLNPFQATYEQMLLSCQYGIPNFPSGSRKGERILPEEMFRRLLIEVNTFARARRLLQDRHLDEELPQWLMRTLPESELPHRRLMDVVYFAGENGSHRIALHPLSERLRVAGEKLRHLMTRQVHSEEVAERSAVAERVEKARKDPFVDVQERVRLAGTKPYFLMPLSYARPGMLCVTTSPEAAKEEHLEQALMERYEGPVYGIELEGDEPLVAGGVVMGLSRPSTAVRPPPAAEPPKS